MPMLVRDYFRAYGRHAATAYAETGSEIAGLHDFRFEDGWMYAAVPNDDDAADRWRRHAQLCNELTDSGSSFYESVARPEIERRLRDLRRRRPRSRSLPSAVRYLELALENYAFIFGYLHWKLFAMDGWDWATGFAEVTGEPKEEAAVLLQGLEHRTAHMVRELRQLARLHQRGDDEGLQAGLGRFLRRYGRRTGSGYGSAIEWATPTWAMRPELALEVVRSYAKQDLDALDAAEREAKRRRVTSLRRVRRKLAAEPELLARFERSYRRARQEALDMENSNALIEQESNGIYREAIDLVGRTLVDLGILDEPDDVFHLGLEELQALADDSASIDAASLVSVRKADIDEQAKTKPPPVLGQEPAAKPDRPEPTLPEDNTVRGTGVSTGSASGRAVVAQPAPAPPEVEPGDILVCNDLGPAWTPIVPLLAGMVLDHGGIYQHAAIVAREYGIPAVLETKVATKVIPNGSTIAIDAAAGTVEVVATAR
jgi:phosphohistidine swiveling domain-containing protein